MELGGHQFSEQLVPSLFPDEPRPALLLRGQEPVDILRFTHDNASQLAALQVNHPVIAVYPIQLPAWGKMDPRELNVATSWHRDLAAGSSQSPWTSTILVNDSGGNLRNRTEWRSNLAFFRLLEANAAVLSDLIQQETTGIDRASLTDDLSCALDTTKSEEDRSAAAHFLFLGLIYQRKACFNDFWPHIKIHKALMSFLGLNWVARLDLLIIEEVFTVDFLAALEILYTVSP